MSLKFFVACIIAQAANFVISVKYGLSLVDICFKGFICFEVIDERGKRRLRAGALLNSYAPGVIVISMHHAE